ncbi:MAG TPA: nuclear transport factor 2 family protein [Bacteroidia bacterium]|nr:nuclear transport factor 2 family protein [Bacteroidia bacterium]
MRIILVIIASLLIPVSSFSQSNKSQLSDTIKSKDSLLFTIGFNTCDIKQFEDLVSDSFEFYHDKAGMTFSKQAFINSIKDGLCNLPYKPKRQLVDSSLKVYPLEKGELLYGVVQTGEHVFYAVEKDKPEYITSTAAFIHIWLLEGGIWKLSRCISYNHRDVRN